MANSPNRLKEYFDEYIVPCHECSKDACIKSLLSYEKLLPYSVSNNARVLLLGHSPRVRTKSQSVINTTLDLNRESSLWRYITKDILTPLGIALKECTATNLVKCQTIKQMPEDIRIDGRKTFMEKAFEYCGRHLEHEILLSNPSLIISLSERVAVLLQKRFSPDMKRLYMQEIFGTKQELRVKGNDYIWIPVVHIPKEKISDYYFPEQTHRLEMLHNQIQDLLQ